MRYLKTINELRKETYLSAANKLSKNHPLRSKKLMDMADEVSDIQYIHPYAFVIDDKRYYITEVTSMDIAFDEEEDEEFDEENEDELPLPTWGLNLDESISNGLKKFIVTLQSVDDKKQMKTPIGDESIEIWDAFEENDYGEEDDEFEEDFDMNYKKFKFSNGKDARMFISIIESETGYKVPFTTNDIYTSK